eukprot:2661548-Pleurochrysis_carterae.AAC.2
MRLHCILIVIQLDSAERRGWHQTRPLGRNCRSGVSLKAADRGKASSEYRTSSQARGTEKKSNLHSSPSLCMSYAAIFFERICFVFPVLFAACNCPESLPAFLLFDLMLLTFVFSRGHSTFNPPLPPV